MGGDTTVRGETLAEPRASHGNIYDVDSDLADDAVDDMIDCGKVNV